MCVFLLCFVFHLYLFYTYGKIQALFFFIWERIKAGTLSRCQYFTEITHTHTKKECLLGRIGFWPGLWVSRFPTMSVWMNCWIPRYHSMQENIRLTAGCLHMLVFNSATWNPLYKAGMLWKFKDFVVGLYFILAELLPNLKKKNPAQVGDYEPLGSILP